MRRLAIFCLPVIALAIPATALALHDASGDGTLVVKDGAAPHGVPVVTLVIDGTAIGHVSSGSPGAYDKVVIDDVNNTNNVGASLTNGAPTLTRTVSDTRTTFVGSDFRFRAAGGLYQVWIYGTGVDVFAVGKGNVTLRGSGSGAPDGRYAINGGAWHSLPPVPSDLLPIKTPPGSSG